MSFRYRYNVGMGSITDGVLQVLDGFHVPAHLRLFVLLGLANLVSIAIGFLVARNVERGSRTAGRIRVPKALPSDREWADDLQTQIRILRDQNKHYRYFMVSFPRILKHLNTTADLEDLASSIVKLTRDAILTETVHLYIYKEENNYLEKLYATGHGSDGIEGFGVGEGIVGRAAEGTAVVNLIDEADEGQGGGPEEDDTGLSMAAPIRFENVLVGVLGAGRISYPTGDEASLMRMFSEVAGVSLYNHAFLGAAKKRAATDPLTGLFNRRHLFEISRDLVKKVATSGGCISLFLFDIDSFKNYNDLNGHGEGDELLKELSALILRGSRESNVVARYGGEEFIIMLDNVSKDNATTYAQRLCEIIASHPFAHREKQPLEMLTISGGVATYPLDGDSIEEVIRHADSALYRAKREGRNRVVIYDPRPFYEEDEAGPTLTQ